MDYKIFLMPFKKPFSKIIVVAQQVAVIKYG